MSGKICGNCKHFAKEPNGGGRGCCFLSDDLEAYPVRGDAYAACKDWGLQMQRSGVYRFPENQRAKKFTLGNQLEYIKDEAKEADDAWYYEEGNERVIEELWDVIQTAEGALRKYAYTDVAAGFYKVLEKCKKRGDYTV